MSLFAAAPPPQVHIDFIKFVFLSFFSASYQSLLNSQNSQNPSGISTSLKLVLFATLFFIAPEAFAQIDTVGEIADHVVNTGTTQSILNLVSGAAYLGGCYMGVKCLVQLKSHTESGGQTKLTKPLISMAVCTMLLTLPSFFNMLDDTLGIAGLSGTIGQLGALATGQAGSACAGGNIGEAFVCLARSIPALYKLVILLASAGGAFLLFKAIYMLPQLEQGRASTSQVLWTMISGIALWSLLPMVDTALNTIGAGTGTTGMVMSKYGQTQGGGTDGAIAAVMLFIQFIGLVAFVRGVLILKALGENKDGAMGRALTHIFGGAAAMNVVWAVGMLAKTVGFYGQVCLISASLCS